MSRHIRSRIAADAIYLAMKPAEWTFYVVLAILDRSAPEARIARMYRDHADARRGASLEDR